MATDYDQRRQVDSDDLEVESLEAIKARRAEAHSGAVDLDEAELAETLELPGADLSAEDLTVRVLPQQADEFVCSRCFLVHHHSQLAGTASGSPVCRDCA